MTELTREQVLDCLQSGWGAYVERIQRLPAAAQAAFLHQQGYISLAGLLAHVAAWWEHGRQSIQRMQTDPRYENPAMDVDSFNAGAVESVRGLDEAQVIRSFETARELMVQFVAGLSERDLHNAKINQQLDWEIVGHLGEHALND